MTAPIGFIVEGIVSDNESYFHLIGRCADTPVCVGDEFETVYAPARVIAGEYQGLGEASAVRLRVERIQAYQRELRKLGIGMTGTIDVRGEGLERVVSGAVLGIPTHVEVEHVSAMKDVPHGKSSG